MQFYVTFGATHYNGDRTNLYDYYVKIDADSLEEATQRIQSIRGKKYAFVYSSPEQAGVYRYGLKPLPLEKLTAQPDRYATRNNSTN